MPMRIFSIKQLHNVSLTQHKLRL